MDESVFDAWSRALAHSQCRRGAAAQAATPTIMASPEPGAEPVCAMPFEATVRLGPSAGLSLRGRLTLEQAQDGGVRGTFTLEEDGAGTDTATGGRELEVVGQVDGRSTSLMIATGDGACLYGVGAMVNELVICRGRMGGPFAGPLPGDLGDWLALPQSGAGGGCADDADCCYNDCLDSGAFGRSDDRKVRRRCYCNCYDCRGAR